MFAGRPIVSKLKLRGLANSTGGERAGSFATFLWENTGALAQILRWLGHANQKATHLPDYSFELQAQTLGALRVAGVDEVGRGPLAGPVTTAAVILDPDNIPDGLNDSKLLSAKKRGALFDVIIATATVSIASASVEEIDQINILQASLLAMRRALEGLSQRPDHALIDGNKLPKDLPCTAEAIIKGDSRSVSIAAASIIAKVTRDRLMVDLGQQFPGYGWENNAGYGTKAHFEGLKRLGVTAHHRRSFKPIHNILYQEI